MIAELTGLGWLALDHLNIIAIDVSAHAFNFAHLILRARTGAP